MEHHGAAGALKRPPGDGLTFADRFHAMYQQVPVIMVTSYSTAPLEDREGRHPDEAKLERPMNSAEPTNGGPERIRAAW